MLQRSCCPILLQCSGGAGGVGEEGEAGQENEELSGSYSMSAYQLLRILVTYNTYECRRFSIMNTLLPAFV